MATIQARRRADGAMRYTATIRVKRGGQVVHSESRTFSRRRVAVEWARARERELERPGALERELQGTAILGDLIRRYIAEMDAIRPLGATKRAHIEYLAKWPIAERDALNLALPDIMGHLRDRRAAGAGPATAMNDLIFLRGVLQTARALWGLPIDLAILDDALRQGKSLQIIAKAQKRTRRPTPQELAALRELFARRDARSKIPMNDIVDFAIASARRQGEIVALRWADRRPADRTILVRDLKHPRQRSGRDRYAKCTRAAWAIMEHQPRVDDRIFPYEGRSIGAAWQRACRILRIEDLRFHDLRAEAVCRLFEAGYQIQEVAMFSLHESWNTLQIYARLKPGDVVERD